MSHVVTLRVKITSKANLIAAVERMGGTWIEGRTRFTWYGRHMGDYKLPEGFSKSEMGHCHHCVSFPGITYQVGLIEIDKLPASHPARTLLDKDGKRVYADGSFVPMFDFWDKALKEKMGGPEALKFIQAYKSEQTKAEARKKGYTKFTEKVDEKTGTVKLEIHTG